MIDAAVWEHFDEERRGHRRFQSGVLQAKDVESRGCTVALVSWAWRSVWLEDRRWRSAPARHDAVVDADCPAKVPERGGGSAGPSEQAQGIESSVEVVAGSAHRL